MLSIHCKIHSEWQPCRLSPFPSVLISWHYLGTSDSADNSVCSTGGLSKFTTGWKRALPTVAHVFSPGLMWLKTWIQIQEEKCCFLCNNRGKNHFSCCIHEENCVCTDCLMSVGMCAVPSCWLLSWSKHCFKLTSCTEALSSNCWDFWGLVESLNVSSGDCGVIDRVLSDSVLEGIKCQIISQLLGLDNIT